jgi:hypothetical protein
MHLFPEVSTGAILSQLILKCDKITQNLTSKIAVKTAPNIPVFTPGRLFWAEVARSEIAPDPPCVRGSVL